MTRTDGVIPRSWLDALTESLRDAFGDGLLFVGLQGSHARGEATGESDVDVVVILRRLDLDALRTYRGIVRGTPFADRCCGFVAGRDELAGWSGSDVFQFYHETEALLGNLCDILPRPSDDDVRRAVKVGAEAIYHGACHEFLFGSCRADALRRLHKAAFFVLQARHFLRTGDYVPTRRGLLPLLARQDRTILETGLRDGLASAPTEEIEKSFGALVAWCSDLLTGREEDDVTFRDGVLLNGNCAGCRLCCGPQKGDPPFPMRLLDGQITERTPTDFHMQDRCTAVLDERGCKALGRDGCRVERPMRPVACNLFPFVLADGRLLLHRSCPTAARLSPDRIAGLAASVRAWLAAQPREHLTRIAISLDEEIVRGKYLDPGLDPLP